MAFQLSSLLLLHSAITDAVQTQQLTAPLNKTLSSLYLARDSNLKPKQIKSEALSLKPSIFPLDKGRNKIGISSSNTNINFVRVYRVVMCDVVSRILPSGQEGEWSIRHLECGGKKKRVLETRTEDRSPILSTLHRGFSMTEINHS